MEQDKEEDPRPSHPLVSVRGSKVDRMSWAHDYEGSSPSALTNYRLRLAL